MTDEILSMGTGAQIEQQCILPKQYEQITRGYLKHGHTWKLSKKVFREFVLIKTGD